MRKFFQSDKFIIGCIFALGATMVFLALAMAEPQKMEARFIKVHGSHVTLQAMQDKTEHWIDIYIEKEKVLEVRPIADNRLDQQMLQIEKTLQSMTLEEFGNLGLLE